METYHWESDAILRAITRAAAADPDTIGLLLSGSRGEGLAAADSDYDLYWVLTDAAYDRRSERGEPLKEQRRGEGRRYLTEISYTCPRRLAEVAAAPGWWTAGYAHATVLLDPTGQIAALVQAIATRPAERAHADAAGWFDSYLNAFYRSMKEWRRGDELGGRLHAAESAAALIRTLFALERRWPPYHDRLAGHWPELASQGWPEGYLPTVLLDLVRTGDPSLQRDLATRVEHLLRAHGLGYVIDAWGGEIERVKAEHPTT